MTNSYFSDGLVNHQPEYIEVLHEHVPSKTQVRPHLDNTSKHYDIMIYLSPENEWKQQLYDSDFDFKFSGSGVGFRVSGFLFWKVRKKLNPTRGLEHVKRYPPRANLGFAV